MITASVALIVCPVRCCRLINHREKKVWPGEESKGLRGCLSGRTTLPQRMDDIHTDTLNETHGERCCIVSSGCRCWNNKQQYCSSFNHLHEQTRIPKRQSNTHYKPHCHPNHIILNGHIRKSQAYFFCTHIETHVIVAAVELHVIECGWRSALCECISSF